jgi:hypothetical protein
LVFTGIDFPQTRKITIAAWQVVLVSIGEWAGFFQARSPPARSERKTLKRKPDLLLVLIAVFGLGVIVSLLAPMTSNDSVAAPASELQAGVIVSD